MTRQESCADADRIGTTPALHSEACATSSDELVELRAEVVRLRQALSDAERRAAEAEGTQQTLRALLACIPEGIVAQRDISERKRAENALREGEERFRVMADGSPVMMWVSDAGRGIRFVNRACREFHGIEEEQVHGGGWEPLVHPDDAPAYVSACESAIRARAPLKAQARVRRADGEWRWIESYGQPRQASQGEHLGYVGISIDITERKRAELEREQLLARIQRSEAELDAVFKALPYLVSVHDKEGRYLRANPAVVELFGLNPVQSTREEVARALNARLPNGEPLTAENMPSSRALSGEPFYDAEYIVTDGRGRDHVLLMNAIPLKSNGQVYGAIFAQMDITQRREAERALERANLQLLEADRQKNQFLAMLSHELRNPLAPIRNSLYVLDRVPPGGEQACKAKAVIDRQVSHLARLVDELLDTTRIVSGKLRLDHVWFDLAEMIRRTADDHRGLFAIAGIDFEARICGGPVWMHGDETRIAQVVGNLLSNSAKFTERGGRVLLAVERDPRRAAALIRVEDTGVGVAPDLLPKLFQPFVQAQQSLERTKGGLGLGLALVRSIIQLHGGEVELQSEGVGKGTEVVARVPIDSREDLGAVDGRPSEELAPLHVLVIDDNVDAADSLRDLLQLAGHEAEVAYSGPQGLEKARAMRPDVVLCDIGLPGMDGYAVAGVIRADPELSSTRLVAVSGYAQPEDLERAKRAGFDRHVAKPPSLERLEQVLDVPKRRA